jgi:CRISPR-associated endonuclease/helicase Cas3
VPGYFKADGVEGSPVTPFKVRWHDEVEEDEVRERRWAAEHPKRYLAGAIVVGTIDQVLLSTLQVKHAHMRASALLRHFLVVDEVHASDIYMTRLLRSVLDQHLASGGHALLMSATLGTASRVRITTDGRGEVPPPGEAKNTGYPLVTHVDATRSDPTLVTTESSGYRKSVEMVPRGIAGDYPAIARTAVEAARDGGRVLIIRNRVQDCIATQKAVETEIDEDEHLLLQVNGTLAPHHSRFAPPDRSRLDDAIERGFGKETPIKGIVAVATQTVEQSLDLSASLLISDLCPVDVLLQRMGRLHRHGRTHPSRFEQARCIVLTPGSRDFAPAIVEGGEKDGWGLKGPHGLGTVYQDLRVIEATWRILEDDDLVTWTIPDDNRRLVECGTHPMVLEEITEELGGLWERHQRWVFGERAARTEASRNVELQRDKNFGDQSFGDDLEFVKTRLGQDDVRIEFSEPLQGPFDAKDSASVNSLSIPEHLIDEVVVDDVEDVNVTDVVGLADGFRFSVDAQEFDYSRFGVTMAAS